MTIKKIKIKNFLSFKDQEINLLENLNIILGRNESGKSNFFKALKVFDLDSSDYDKYANRILALQDIPIEIEVLFNKIDIDKKQFLESLLEKEFLEKEFLEKKFLKIKPIEIYFKKKFLKIILLNLKQT